MPLAHSNAEQRSDRVAGPKAQTISDQVAVIGEAIARSLCFEEVPPEAARASLLAGGFIDGFAAAYLRMLDAACHSPATVTSTVRDVTGHEATSFARWAEEHVDPFRGQGRVDSHHDED